MRSTEPSTQPSTQPSNEPPLDPAELEARAAEAESFLRSIASRHRLMILCSLLDGEMPVGDLARRLGLSQSNLSQHLAKLRDEGLVATRRDGTSIHYRIGSDRVRPILLELYRQFCVGARCVAGADPAP
ncbi:helix-turn-helix transcriptional regulator [Azospirillum sp. TSH58]|uniref:ArsR/SmtB family transcription factor n=1 Tax=Azospirillum sp. TSH58 TaxID=664962 RepID=UPI0018EE7036|nr:metalloregulator ArsR/SmtB family transcription factor [Azospirillum sp. TSH58]